MKAAMVEKKHSKSILPVPSESIAEANECISASVGTYAYVHIMCTEEYHVHVSTSQ